MSRGRVRSLSFLSSNAALAGQPAVLGHHVRTALLALFCSAPLLVSGRAVACDFPPPEVAPGVVAHGFELPALPRNVAFLWHDRAEQLPAEGVTVGEKGSGRIVAHPLRDGPSHFGTYLVRPNEPLDPDVKFSVYRYGALANPHRTGDYLDEAPPERPVIRRAELSFHDGTQGCATDSCGDLTWLSLELEDAVSDDHTRSEDIVYVLYLGGSAAEVRNATRPFAYLEQFSVNVEESWLDRNAFIAVAALDHAGNESERSEPFRVERSSSSESEGCAIGPRRSRTLVASTYLLVVACALLRRLSRR